jgi:hypothetical protein
MIDLGTLPGSPISQANFINSRSQVVGDSTPCDFSSITGFLWEDGSLVDLNALVPPSTPYYIFTTSFISDRGEIAAFGSPANGDMHALLLIPCDEEHPDVEGCDYSQVEASGLQPPSHNSGSPTLSDGASGGPTHSSLLNRHRRFFGRNSQLLP